MHDPATAPDPDAWLQMDERERTTSMVAWHTQNPNPILHAGRALNADLHANLHAAVETQIASNNPPVVRLTVERLTEEGTNRHAVLHAIMEALVLQMQASMGTGQFDNDAFAADLGQLDASVIVSKGLKRAHRVLRRQEEKQSGNRASRRSKKKGK